jgi:undecaprenyl pyrophosphate phosphatase UppP
MKTFFSNLNQWLRKIDRWLVIPVVLILVVSRLSLETPVSKSIQPIQQVSLMFMVVTGLYLYLYRQWSILQRKKRTTEKISARDKYRIGNL